LWLKLAVTYGTRGKASAPPEMLQLWNRLRTLVADKWLAPLSNEASKSAEPQPCSSTRRKWQVGGSGILFAEMNGGLHLPT